MTSGNGEARYCRSQLLSLGMYPQGLLPELQSGSDTHIVTGTLTKLLPIANPLLYRLT